MKAGGWVPFLRPKQPTRVKGGLADLPPAPMQGDMWVSPDGRPWFVIRDAWGALWAVDVAGAWHVFAEIDEQVGRLTLDHRPAWTEGER